VTSQVPALEAWEASVEWEALAEWEDWVDWEVWEEEEWVVQEVLEVWIPR